MIKRVINKIKYLIYLSFELMMVKNQQNDVARIYDDIWKKKKIKSFDGLSNEIQDIVKKINEIGYLDRKIVNISEDLKITVIIPHYNQTKYLDASLKHLSSQTVLPDEIIVVDDISDNFDQVQQVCDKYQNNLPINLIKANKKLYAGGAKQLGAEKASGDVLIMHDADDISQKNRIEVIKLFFNRYPQALHLTAGYVRFNKNDFLDYIGDLNVLDLDQFVIKTETIRDKMRKIFVDQKFSAPRKITRLGHYGVDGRYGFFTQAGHVAYRKEVSKLLKWSSPFKFVFTKFEDYDFNLMLLLLGQRSYHIDLPLVYYRGGTTTNDINY